MTDVTQVKPDFMRFVKSNIRDYALLLSLLAIMVFFQFNTNGTLFKPVNMTNLLLQNSYIVVMALCWCCGRGDDDGHIAQPRTFHHSKI
jgi:putative multiple sugar transport system permease protein